MHILSQRILIASGLIIAFLPATLLGQGKVYLVVGSDTAIWDSLDLTRQHCHFLSDLYTNPQRNAYRVMDPAFRNRFVDSYGHPLKMSWWMLVGSVHLASDNIDVPVPNLMPLHLMTK